MQTGSCTGRSCATRQASLSYKAAASRQREGRSSACPDRREPINWPWYPHLPTPAEASSKSLGLPGTGASRRGVHTPQAIRKADLAPGGPWGSFLAKVWPRAQTWKFLLRGTESSDGNAAALCPEEEGKQVTALVWSLRGSSQAQPICLLAPLSPRCLGAGGETKGHWRLNSETQQLRRTGCWAPASLPPPGPPQMKMRLHEARTPRAGTALGQSWTAPVPADRHLSRLTYPISGYSSEQGCSPSPPPQLLQLHPQPVRGAQGAPGWGGYAPCPHPRNFRTLSPPSLDGLMYRDRCGRRCCKDRGEGVGEQVIRMVLHPKH